MKSIRIELDEATYKALNQIAPTAKRLRAQFIRDALRKAIRHAEYEETHKAYVGRPDSESEADDWSTAQEYRR
jgi:metal-responsive CopG/Arc/MetJ family transcriptional regulator